MKLHLLDGTYELFRAHFGAPEREAPDGRPVGAVAGIISSTLSLLREPDVTHVAAATDHVIESYRNDLFEGYKTSEGMPEELLSQFQLAEDALAALGVVVWPMVEFEADDAIAAAADRYSDDFDQIVMLTPDKDLSQCVVDDHIVSYDRRRQQFRDETGVVEKFGVLPGSIPDYLGLVGDSADGIPGLAGWGAKSTAAVLARYRHLELIPLDGDWDIPVRSSAKLAATLAEEMEAALLYRELATLRRDVPLTESVADLEWRGVIDQDYLALCDELGFTELRSRPHRWAD